MKKKLFYFLVSKLPIFFRHFIYRQLFAKVPKEISEGLVFELAKTKEDLESAFRLLHDAYVDQGFIQKKESGMHLIVQHALPNCGLLVAKFNNKVIGTISIMRDSPLGLPMEKAFDISGLKSNGGRVAELSSLVVHPQFRRKMGQDIFFPLTLFASIFAKKCFGTDYLVFNLYPHHADFYNAIFGSSHLNNYKGVSQEYLGAPATGIKLNLNTVEEFAYKKYSGLSLERDLHSFTFVRDHKFFKFPGPQCGVINYPVMTPELLKYFFCEKNNIFKDLSLLEKQVLKKYYPGEEYAHFGFDTEEYATRIRVESRWDVRIQGKVHLMNQDKTEALVLMDISLHGFRAFVNTKLNEETDYSIEIEIQKDQFFKINASVVWSSMNGVYGFSISESNEEWRTLIFNQEEKLSKLAS